MSTEPPRTCYIAAAMSSVPVEKRPELRKKREAIATFFRDGYSIVCSHYKVLYAKPEKDSSSKPEQVSIVTHDLTLVNAADIVVMWFEGTQNFSWRAAVKLGYAYGCRKKCIVFNLSYKDTNFFMKYLPQDANHEVYIIEDEQSLDKFTHSQVYKLDEVRKQLRTLLGKDAATSVQDGMRPELREKREAIAKFLRGDSSTICKDLYDGCESRTSNTECAEQVSIVARDLTLVNAAEIVVFCFEGEKIYSWGAAIELGYAYGCGKPVVIVNLSEEDTYFRTVFMQCLPTDAKNKVYIVNNKDELKDFAEKFAEECKPEACLPDKVKIAREQLEEVLF